MRRGYPQFLPQHGAVWFIAAQNGFVSEGSPCGAEPAVLLIQKYRSGAALSP